MPDRDILLNKLNRPVHDLNQHELGMFDFISGHDISSGMTGTSVTITDLM